MSINTAAKTPYSDELELQDFGLLPSLRILKGSVIKLFKMTRIFAFIAF